MPVAQRRGSLLKELCIVPNNEKGWKERDQRALAGPSNPVQVFATGSSSTASHELLPYYLATLPVIVFLNDDEMSAA
jgi:hypothetical protein